MRGGRVKDVRSDFLWPKNPFEFFCSTNPFVHILVHFLHSINVQCAICTYRDVSFSYILSADLWSQCSFCLNASSLNLICPKLQGLSRPKKPHFAFCPVKSRPHLCWCRRARCKIKSSILVQLLGQVILCHLDIWGKVSASQKINKITKNNRKCDPQKIIIICLIRNYSRNAVKVGGAGEPTCWVCMMTCPVAYFAREYSSF